MAGAEVKDSSSQEEVNLTPEATRPPAAPDGLPGARTGRDPTRTSSRASRAKGGLRKCTYVLSFVPWFSLFSVLLLVGGIAVFAIKGKSAGEEALTLLDSVNSESTGYHSFLSIYTRPCWYVTLGVTGGCIAAVFILGSLRTDQRLRKAGKIGTSSKGGWGRWGYKSVHCLSILALLLLVLSTAWFLFNLALLSTWNVLLWNVREGAMVQGNVFTSVEAAGNASLPTDALTPANGMVCPSTACLNLQLYPFLESTSCVCSQPLLLELFSRAQSTLHSCTWAIIGMGCLFLGSFLGSMQLAADVPMVTADQQWMRVVRRRSSRSPTKPTSTNQLYESADAAGIMATPGSARRGTASTYMSPPGYSILATATTTNRAN